MSNVNKQAQELTKAFFNAVEKKVTPGIFKQSIGQFKNLLNVYTYEELEKVINPFYDNYHEYIITYVMPEVIAFYIASSFSRNAMWEATFYQHYNSAKDTFNVSDDEDYDSIKAEVIKLLRMKYSLEIISEDPLDFKKIEY